MRKVLLLGIMLLCVNAFAFAQGRVIKGTVIASEDGQPVPGVSVTVKGTTIGTATDVDGSYSLTVPEGRNVLTFSFVGLATQEVSIGNKSVINVTLDPDIQALSEVVITGYGPESRDKLTSSVAVIGSRTIENIPMPSFDQILQGQAPGLYVTAGSGQPGSSARVRIRGDGSINGGNQPLYILDGAQIDAGAFATLNPNDFESVSVLKDASATAVYGSRGANGVIVITSKMGKIGPAVINYRTQFGIAEQARERFQMMNSEEKINFEQIIKSGPTVNVSEEERQRLRNINTDWTNLFIRRGTTQTHEINVSGGTDRVKYYTSVNYLDQQGQAPRSGLERYTTRINLDVFATEKLRFGIKSTIGYSKSQFIESEGGVALANPFAAAYLANPYEEPFDEQGNRRFGPGLTGPNAYDRIFTTTNGQNEIKGVGSLFGEYTILPELTLRSTFGVDYRSREFERWIDPTSWAGRNVSNGNQGLFSNSFNKRFIYTSTTLLNYNKTFAEKHEVSGTAGIEAIENIFNSFSFTGYGINPKLPETPAGITPGSATGFIPAVSGSKFRSALLSYLAIGNYTYDGKYNFKASIRRDGSSRFGEDTQFATLWSLGGAWNVSNESFLVNNNTISNLRLRASYGVVGNQEGIGVYQAIPTYGTVSYAGLQGIAPAAIGNPLLQWELSNQANLGIDFGLFKDRLSGTLDVYNNITSKLFVTTQLSRTTGFSSLQSNEGKVRNRGIEFNLNYDIISTRDMFWSIGGNIAYNQNEIVDLGQVDEFEQGTSIIRVGLPIGTHYIVEWAGVNPTNGEPLYRDIDGNVTNIYTQDNNVPNFGTFIPPTTGGFNTSFRYKGFSLNALFVFAEGLTRFNNQSFFQENHDFAQFNLSRQMLTIWQNPGDITEIQAANTQRQFSSKDLEDASYLRFRNLTLGYSLPASIVQRTGIIRSVQLFAQGQNLFTWTNWTGFDPEDDNNIAQYEYPASRIFTLGLDVRF